MDGIFLTEITIEHVRHLRDIVIPLSSDMRKTLILTGQNGSGKTSVLQALGDFLRFTAKIPGDLNEKELIRFQVELTEQRMLHMASFDQELSPRQSLTKVIGISSKCTHWKKMKKSCQNGSFILDYFADEREIQVDISNHVEKVDFKSAYPMNDNPSRDFVKYMVDIKVRQALANMKEEGSRVAEIEDWFQRFQDVLRKLYNDPPLTLDFDIDTFRFTIHATNREPFDFNTMSMGYSAIFNIITDLIMRMEAKSPGHYNMEGIVLIDEIETHLHVELQKKIVPILTELFPNIQFIMTTHSPFVLQSAENAVIYDLEKRVLVRDGLANLPYEGIVEGYFGVDTLSAELKEKFQRYQELIQKKELTDGDYVEIDRLESYLDEIPHYLAPGWAAEYRRLKLEFSMREGA